MRGMIAVAVLAMAGVLSGGCATAPAAPRAVPVAGIGRSVEGRPMVVERLGQGPAVLVVAGVHGNEAAGVPLAERLVAMCRADPSLLNGHKLVVVSQMNPDGVAAGTRGNARGVDLNRNWPAANRRERSASGPAALSEPESTAMHVLIDAIQPVRILTIHQPLTCVDYDGPAEALAHAIADATGLPAKKLGGRPGSMGSYLGIDRGIPIVTLELPRNADRLDDAGKWDRYGVGLLTFLRGTAEEPSRLVDAQ